MTRALVPFCALALAAGACDDPPPPPPAPPPSPTPSAPVAERAAAPTPTPAPPSPSAGAPSAAASGHDPCLVGSWTLTSANAEAYYRALLAHSAGGAAVEVQGVEGTSHATFGADGSSTYSMDHIRFRYRIPGAGGAVPIDTTMTLDGRGTGRWQGSGGVASVVDTDFHMEGDIAMNVRGREMRTRLPETTQSTFGGAHAGGMRYTCSANTLVARYDAMPDVAVTWVR